MQYCMHTQRKSRKLWYACSDMYVCIVCVNVWVLGGHGRTYTYTLLLFVSLFLFILSVTSFLSISSLCMHMICYNTKHTHDTHTHRVEDTAAGIIFKAHLLIQRHHVCIRSRCSRAKRGLVHTRVKRPAGRATATSVWGLKILATSVWGHKLLATRVWGLKLLAHRRPSDGYYCMSP